MKKGFTLIELLLVVAIIGLLALLSFVALNSSARKARNSKRLADVVQYSKALEIYFLNYNSYPAANWSCLGDYETKGVLNETNVCGADNLLRNEYEPFLNSIREYIPELPAGSKVVCGDRTVIGYTYNLIPTLTYGSECAYQNVEIQWMMEGVNQSCGPGRVRNSSWNGCTWCVYCSRYK